MLGKRLLMLVAGMILLSAVPAMAGRELPNVVAVVNGEKISKDELVAMLVDWQAAVVLDEMIAYRIVGQEARKAGIVVTVAEVKAKMEELKKGMPPGQDFEEMLKQRGITPGHAFASIKMRLQAERVLQKSIKVGPEELEGYRKASHVLVRINRAADPKEQEKNDAEGKVKIDKVAQEIKDGLAFEEAAKKYSDDFMTKEKGGDLGFFSKTQMTPEFSEVAFNMKPGEISDPVKTPYGYHIIKFVMTGSDATGEERKNLEEQVIQMQIGQQYGEWMLSIRNKAQVDNKLEPKKPEPIAQPGPPRPVPPPAPEEAPPPPPAPEEAPPPPPSESAAPPATEAAPAAETPPAPPAQPAPAN